MKKTTIIPLADRSTESALGDSSTTKVVNAQLTQKGHQQSAESAARTRMLVGSRGEDAAVEDSVVGATMAADDAGADLSTSVLSHLDALASTPFESFSSLAQAAAATATSAGSGAAASAGAAASMSAVQIAAVAAGVVVVGAAAGSSGGGSSGGGSGPAVVPVPTIAKGAVDGSVSVTLGAGATKAKLFDGSTDVSAKFVQTTSGPVVTFAPLPKGPNGTELVGKQLTAKAVDAAGTESLASATLSYSFDNVPPASAPTVSAASTGVITVSGIGADATTAKLFSADGAEVTSKFTPGALTGGVLAFTPIAKQIEGFQSVTAKAADAAGNVSGASASASYTFDNKGPLAPSEAKGDASSGVVTVKIGSANGEVPSSVKLFAGTTEITDKYVSDVSQPGTVKFVPVAGQLAFSSPVKLTAVVSDAAGNPSDASPSADYSFVNAVSVGPADEATTFKAAPANYLYTLAAGDYKATIDGFGVGDRLVFKGATVPTVDVYQDSFTDGTVVLKATTAAGVVSLTLQGVGAADAALNFESSFNTAFGANTLTKVAESGGTSTTAVAISAKGSYDAAGGNFAYTVAEGGAYEVTISNFGAGDTLNFSGSTKVTPDLTQTSFTDGQVVLAANFPTGVVDVTLANLQPPAADASLNFAKDLNTIFGAGTLTSTVTGAVAPQSVVISQTNASTVQNANGGDFTYKISEGNYKVEISGFTPGDSLDFFGQKVATIADFNNSDFTDGRLLIVATTPDGSDVTVLLSGLTAAADNALIFQSSFNKYFGANSLIA